MGRTGAPAVALSRREQEVAALVAEGLTNRAIAQRMFISERTVDGHLEHIREKLGVSNRAQVATWFVSRSAAPQIAAPPALPRPRGRNLNLLLPVAAVAVVALVAGAILYERSIAVPRAGPAITEFRSVNPNDRLRFPWSVAVGRDAAVYVGDQGNVRIRKIDPKGGSILTFAGGNAPDQFVDGSDKLTASISFVTGIAISPDGTLYFASHFLPTGGPGMVGRVNADSTVEFIAGARSSADRTSLIKGPAGLAFASDGTLYIADLGGNRIWKRTPDGALTAFAGNGQEGFLGDGGAAAEAELDRPRALAIESDGDMLIADTGNNRVREVIHGSERIVTLAGAGDYYGFSGDGGPATEAKMSLPWGVAVGPDGTIYVADAGNDRVRSISAKGTITTLAHADLNAPTGLAVSPSGDLYVVELGGAWLRLVHLSRGSAA